MWLNPNKKASFHAPVFDIKSKYQTQPVLFFHINIPDLERVSVEVQNFIRKELSLAEFQPLFLDNSYQKPRFFLYSHTTPDSSNVSDMVEHSVLRFSRLRKI